MYKRSGMDMSQKIPEKCFLAYLPFYHTIGINGIFDQIFTGTKCVVLSNYTFTKFLQTVQEFKVSGLKILLLNKILLKIHFYRLRVFTWCHPSPFD